MGFKKFDAGKPKMSLVPTKALRLIAEIMTMGEKKYGKFNHLQGTDWLRYADPAMRHINSWLENEVDPESGKSHLAHAAASIMILLELELRGIGIDDRFKDE